MTGSVNAPFDTVQVSLSLDRTLFSSIGSDSKSQLFLMNDLLNRCLGTMTFESQNTSTLSAGICPRSTPEDNTVLIKDEPADVQVEEVYTDPCSISTIPGLSDQTRAIKQDAIDVSTSPFNARNNSAAVEEASTSVSIVDSKSLPSEDDASTNHRNITREINKRKKYNNVSGCSQNQPMSPANRPNVAVVETKIHSNTHVQVVHDKSRSGERNEQFGQLSHSPGHEKARNRKRLYACDVCGEKPYNCEYCKYSCNSSYGLTVHRRIHTPSDTAIIAGTSAAEPTAPNQPTTNTSKQRSRGKKAASKVQFEEEPPNKRRKRSDAQKPETEPPLAPFRYDANGEPLYELNQLTSWSIKLGTDPNKKKMKFQCWVNEVYFGTDAIRKHGRVHRGRILTPEDMAELDNGGINSLRSPTALENPLPSRRLPENERPVPAPQQQLVEGESIKCASVLPKKTC